MHLDTHVVVWLYTGDQGAFPFTVRRRLEREPLVVSPMVLLELDMLHEIGRTTVGSPDVLAELRRTLGLDVATTPFQVVAAAASQLTWTRDPFDRLICAQALAEGQPLLTKDRLVREHLDLAAWE